MFLTVSFFECFAMAALQIERIYANKIFLKTRL